MLRAVVAPASFVIVVGCSSGVVSEQLPATAPAGPSAPAIAKIVTRDRTITLSAGHGTVRATVLDGDGKVVARDVDVDALQTIDASAYDACHQSFAGASGGDGLMGRVAPLEGRLLGQ